MKNLKSQLLVLLLCTVCFADRRLCTTDALARILHEHCRSGHELRNLESASQTTYIRFDLSSIPADYSGANIPKVRRYKVIQLQPVAGSEDQVIEITNPLKEILNIALI